MGKYRYMSIGSCCASLDTLGCDRIKGPVDNMRSKNGLSDSLHVLNKDLYNIVLNNNYTDYLSPTGEVRNDLIYYNNIHFDINTHKDGWFKRYDTLLNFVSNLGENDFIVYFLSSNDIDNSGRLTLEFMANLNELFKLIPKNNFILVGGKSERKDWWYRTNVDYNLVDESINYIILDNIYKWNRDATTESLLNNYVDSIKNKTYIRPKGTSTKASLFDIL